MAMAWRSHPRWHLILIGNRDELHARPAAALAHWDDYPSVIGGRDLQSGGSWLGVSESGGCAIVTNRRGFGAPEPGRVSRGQLVADLLTEEGEHSDPQTVDVDQFNPFNLVVIDQSRAHFLTNRPKPIRAPLGAGLYGLSNGSLDEPWPKTLQLKASLLNWMTGEAKSLESLFDALHVEQLPGEGFLPDCQSDAADEAIASPIFIRHPIYGTRCSTIVAVDVKGHGAIIERRFDSEGAITGETDMPIRWKL